MRHDWKFLREKDTDTQKKMLLPVLVIPLVVIVLMIVIVLAEYGKKRSAEQAAVTETVETETETMPAETEDASAEEETDTESETETEAAEENGDPYATENFTHDSVPEVLSLMKKYFAARASADADTMNEIYGVSGLSFTELEHEKTRLRSNSKYVQV